MSTVGIELEWSDIDRWQHIPEHLGKWSTEDYSIVNSDGHANHPTGDGWRWGGEINTKPTDGPGSQANIVRQLLDLFQSPSPVINYKDNLHVHVAPSINFLVEENLTALKRFAHFLRDSEEFVYSVVEPLQSLRPTQEEFPDPEEYAGARKRWKRNLTSHQHRLSDDRFDEMMGVSCVRDFKDAMAPPTKKGGRAWHVAPRPGMNLRSLWKHGTVEFRHFPGSADPDEIYAAVHWCQSLVDCAVSWATGEEDVLPTGAAYEACESIFRNLRPHGQEAWRFPWFRRYDHKLQLGFEKTRYTPS